MTAPTLRPPRVGQVSSLGSAGPAASRQTSGPVHRTGLRSRRGLTGVVVVVVAEAVLVAPAVGAAVTSIRAVDGDWLAVAVVAAAASMSMFARLRRRLLLAAGVRTSARGSVVAVYVANALHATLPGGAAFSTTYTYRWMRGRGASGSASTWVLAAGGLVSTASLLALGPLGALLAGGRAGLLQQGLEIAGILVVAGVVRHPVRHPQLIRNVCGRVLALLNLLRHRAPTVGAAALDDLVIQLQAVRPRAVDWSVAIGFALLNWGFDMGCLAACAAALNLHGLTLPLLLAAYTAGMATSGLSPLPGGIGVVDSTLVLALVAGGVPVASALPVVVLYRLISLVGVVAVGWILCVVAQVLRVVVTGSVAQAGHRDVTGHGHRSGRVSVAQSPHSSPSETSP